MRLRPELSNALRPCMAQLDVEDATVVGAQPHLARSESAHNTQAPSFKKHRNFNILKPWV